MTDKATARALAVRGHPSFLEQVRPEHAHIRAYLRAENVEYHKKQSAWLSGYHRFGDELEAAYAVAEGDSPREQAEDVAVRLDDPWMMRGRLRSEVSEILLTVFEALRSSSKRRGAALLWDVPPGYAAEVIEWVGRYDIPSDAARSWSNAVSLHLMTDPTVHSLFSAKDGGRPLGWRELLLLARSGASAKEVQGWYRAHKATASAGVQYFVDGVPLSEVLDRDTLGRSMLHRAYSAHPLLDSLWDWPGRRLRPGLSTLGPGAYKDELLQAARGIPVQGPRDAGALRKLATAVDDPWKLFGLTASEVPQSYRVLWDSFGQWPGRLNMVALLADPLSMEDAERYAQWLGKVSSHSQAAVFVSWEGLVLSAAIERAVGQWPYLSRYCEEPWDMDREDLRRLMSAATAESVGMAIIQEKLTAPELVAHFVDGVPLDYIQAMR